MPVIYNPSETVDIDIDDLGITVQKQQLMDITYIRRLAVRSSNDLRAAVTNSTIAFVNENTSDYANSIIVTYDVSGSLEMIENGVTGSQVGVNKPTRPGIIEGNYYGVVTDASLVNDSTPEGHLNAIPVNYLDTYFNRIGVCVTTAVPNGVVRLGVYENENGKPGKLLLDAGEVPCDTAGNKEIIIDFHTPNDWCFLSTHTNAEIEFKSVTSQVSVFGNASDDLTSVVRHIHTDVTYTGTLPETFPANSVTSSSYPPFVWFRKV